MAQHILRRLFAAVAASAALSVVAIATASAAGAGAGAGVIEGTVTFPSQRVPSMTVYVSDLDTSHVRSAQLARGQANFTIEVPYGRYWVFLAPNEPGAPNIYGAYTQYSLCAHDTGATCDDHALVATAVSARATRAAVTIDDWYLSDDIADQIDLIRSVAADIRVRGHSDEPLGAPRFSEYPSATVDVALPAKIDMDRSGLSEQDRAYLQQSLSRGPNFAGHMTAVEIRCGSSCVRLVLLDWQSGQIQEQQQPAEIQGPLPCRTDEVLLVRRDSRLLSMTRTRGPAVVTQYYVWNPKIAALVQSGEYQRNSRTFCAVAAR